MNIRPRLFLINLKKPPVKAVSAWLTSEPQSKYNNMIKLGSLVSNEFIKQECPAKL